MRPDAEADGLICIIAHDHSIVKIKISIGYSVAVVDYELCVYLTPVLTASSPLFRMYVVVLAVKNFYSASFIPTSSGIAVNGQYLCVW